MTSIALHAPVPTSSFRRLSQDRPHAQLVHRLCDLSARNGHEPFGAIAWDAPEHQLLDGDPRFALGPDQPLAQTDWYAQLSDGERARFGLEWVAQTLKYGTGFEAVLSRGLFEFAQSIPNRTPEYRYALCEVVEEARHSMMFQEFIDRSGTDPLPVRGLDRALDDRVAKLGRSFPELFFFAVLAGEIFIDEQNREQLQQPAESSHPLLRRIMQIHVMEEARHVRFAASVLRERLPQLGRMRREWLAFALPPIFADTRRMLLEPDRRLRARYALPRAAMRQAYGPGSAHRHKIAAVLAPIHELCAAHGLLARRHALVWRMHGLLG